MTPHRTASPLLCLSLTSVFALSACGGDDSTRDTSADDGISDAGTGDGDDAGTEDGDDGSIPDLPDDGPNIVELKIDPPNAVIEIVDGVVPAATDFTAFGVNDEGVETNIEGLGSWAWDRIDIAGLDPADGSLAATGLLGGKGTLRFSYNGLEAEAEVTVKLAYNLEPAPVDPGSKAALDGPSQPDPAMALLYPYNGTVFPRGLLGPTIQWNGGTDTDLYKITASSDTFELSWYGNVPNPSRWDFPVVPEDIWLKLTDSTEGDVLVEVRRFDGTTAFTSGTQTWTIAPANLAGTIYYWAVNQGDVLRIQPGASAPEQFLQKPEGVTCLACHSVSMDGTTIVASANGGPSPWATFNADGSNIYASPQASGFQAISPDGSWILWGQSNGTFLGQPSHMVLSPVNSDQVSAQLFATTGFPVHPAWSPDGTKISYGVRTDGGWLDFNQSTLWVVDIDLTGPSFGTPQQIAVGDAQRPMVSYPTFSPDSEWIAYARATQARTRGAAGEVWMIRADGTEPVRLDLANGFGHIDAAQTAQNYEPTFMPVASGGYYWMVFVSERQYGNTLTNQDVNSRIKQLWVSAVDVNAPPGTDPSHAGFWLPGQELDNNNMRGFAALNECKELGDTCEAGYDCCSGFCVESSDQPGVFVCDDEVPMCSPNESACDETADCCDPESECIAGFCTQLIG